MKVTGIIAEYNPLHNGHKYHIENARAKTGSDYTVVIMSGDHVQRGCPAIFSKYERTKEALLAGADLVIELPVYYATGSLEYFANGAVSLLNKLNIIDTLSFGSECGDLQLLYKASRQLAASMSCNNQNFRTNISQGITYARALSEEITSGNNSSSDSIISEVLKHPNNSLAIGYITALYKLNSNISCHTVKRIESQYHDEQTGAFSSTSVRKEIFSSDIVPVLDRIKAQVPEKVSDSISNYINSFSPLCENDYSMMLYYKLNELYSATANQPALGDYMDVSESLANKILSNYQKADSYTDLCQNLKSKDLTYSRISRSLLHILLGITKQNMNEYIQDGYIYYGRILGFKKSAAPLLHELKIKSEIPLISKLRDGENTIREFYENDKYLSIQAADNTSNQLIISHAIRMLREDINSSEIYNKAVCYKSRQPFKSEYEQQIVII